MKIYSLVRLKNRLILTLLKNNALITGHIRARLYKSFRILKIGNGCFIGRNVHFDDLCLDKIQIGDNVMITQNVSVLTHFYDIKCSKLSGVHSFYTGDVKILNDVFIGMNTLIVKPLEVGEGAVIGAGVVLSSNVSPNAVVVSSNSY